MMLLLQQKFSKKVDNEVVENFFSFPFKLLPKLLGLARNRI